MDSISAAIFDAGKEILRLKQSLVIRRKPDGTPVTSADEASHDILVRALNDIDPHTPVISEEAEIQSYEGRSKWKRFWLLDPIDGTVDLMRGEDTYTICLGLVENGKATAGYIYAPERGTFYRGEVGSGAEESVGGRGFTLLARSSPSSLLVYSERDSLEEIRSRFPETNSLPTRALGGALKFALLAKGEASTYIRLSPQSEWDVAAGDGILRAVYPTHQYDSPFLYNSENLRVKSFMIALR